MDLEVINKTYLLLARIYKNMKHPQHSDCFTSYVWSWGLSDYHDSICNACHLAYQPTCLHLEELIHRKCRWGLSLCQPKNNISLANMKTVKKTFGIWPAILSTTSGTGIIWGSYLIHASSSTSSTITLDFLDLEPDGAVAELTESEWSFCFFCLVEWVLIWVWCFALLWLETVLVGSELPIWKLSACIITTTLVTLSMVFVLWTCCWDLRRYKLILSNIRKNGLPLVRRVTMHAMASSDIIDFNCSMVLKETLIPVLLSILIMHTLVPLILKNSPRINGMTFVARFHMNASILLHNTITYLQTWDKASLKKNILANNGFQLKPGYWFSQLGPSLIETPGSTIPSSESPSKLGIKQAGSCGTDVEFKSPLLAFFLQYGFGDATKVC